MADSERREVKSNQEGGYITAKGTQVYVFGDFKWGQRPVGDIDTQRIWNRFYPNRKK